MNRDEIKQFLPHREPMLLVDELELLEGGSEGIGKYTVRGDEWFLKGHFPGYPLVPGVVLCEMMGQSCGLLLGDFVKGKRTFLTGVDKARFKGQVFPGDTVVIRAKVTRRKGPFVFTECSAEKQDGSPVCTASLSFALLEPDDAQKE